MCSDSPLSGFVVGVTADRRAAEQIELLERKGATVMHGPAIRTHPLAPEADLAAATRDLIDRPPTHTLLTTAIGARAWFEAAEAMGLADDLHAALAMSTVLVRGPKAHGAAVTLGLPVAWQAPGGAAVELVDELARLGPRGARVAVQLDGAPDNVLAAAVADLGADAVAVPVYRWTMPDDPAPARRLIAAIVDRRVDAVTFTAGPQVRNLVALATEDGNGDHLVAAMAGAVRAVCVGPVCAAAAADAGFGQPIVPGRARLGTMILALVAGFADRGRRLDLAGTTVRQQGRMVRVGNAEPIMLSDRERTLFEALATKPGRVLSKGQLLEQVWVGVETDTHVVEVTVARLRQRLGVAGSGIETIHRRGYRLTPA